MSGSIGAQVILDPASPASQGARGVAASTLYGNTVARDLGLISNGLDPLLTAGPPTIVVPFSLNFMRPGWLDPGVTFSRASTATYTDASGTIRSAAVNAPRWDYVGGVLRGLLIEEARQNIWLQSADASNGIWGVFGNPTAPVVTGNQTISPDGANTAARVVYPAVGAGATSILFESFTMTAAPWAFSLWLRGNVGGERVYLMANTGATYYKQTCVLTTAWQRFTLVTPALTAVGWNFTIGADLRDATQTPTAAQTVFMWGGQLEAGAFATSTIYTTAAAVTRAFDNCFISPANMSPWFASPGGSWFAEFIDNVPFGLSSPRVVGIHDASAFAPVWLSAGGNLNSYDGAVIGTATVVTVGAVSKGITSWAPGTGKFCLNGGSVGTGAQTTGFATLATAGVSILGGNPGLPNESMTGYVRRVSYWPRVLTDAEMQAVTT